MTLLECLYKYLITEDSTLAAKLPGGLKPRLITQSSSAFQNMATVRMISGAGERPTHDGGASPWCKARIEITVWGANDKTNEQTALYIMDKMLDFDGYIGGGTDGRFASWEIQGPRHITDEQSHLGGVQIDLIGMLNRSTLS